MKFNYHTHTYRCGHAIGEDEQYILSAIQAGFTVIGISDHIPFKGISEKDSRMDYTELDGYLASFKMLKEKYKNQIEIKIGLEMEYFDEYYDYYLSLLNEIDYFIIGQHYKHVPDYDYCNSCNDEDLECYVSAIEKAVQKQLVKYIAHPDYFMMGRDNWNDKCTEVAYRICKLSKQYNIPIELNLNGIKYGKREYKEGLRYCYPFYDFWKVAEEVQCPVLMGYDAHYPECLLESSREHLILDIVSGLKLNRIHEFSI